MNILSDEQYRALGFIAACNQNHYAPTPEQVPLWLDNPEPTEAVYRTVKREIEPVLPSPPTSTASTRMLAETLSEAMSESLRSARESITQAFGELTASHIYGGNRFGLDNLFLKRTITERELVTAAETVIEHLIRLTWLEEVPTTGHATGLRLTELGRALLRDRETDSDTGDEDVSVVVLGRDDPLAYPTLVGQLAAAGPALLVDPYLKLGDLHRLVVSTSLTRLLVSGKPNNSTEIAAMQAYLDSTSLPRRVEVRSSTKLHDRYLIADDGDVLTLGTSLNGVGRTTTVLTPIPTPASESLRNEYEQLWGAATLIGPPPVETDDPEAQEEGDPDHDGQQPPA